MLHLRDLTNVTMHVVEPMRLNLESGDPCTQLTHLHQTVVTVERFKPTLHS